MVRVHIKGGVWKNTEDEILKAAISKYGMNQWARISSLLTRKTPKQCKARWYEWLDPSIKKTEWSKEEDEKLLHLAKLMPTQWRTIAPIVGRTTTQCIERYQRLLDEAEDQQAGPSGTSSSSLSLTGVAGPEAGPSAEDVRRLRPGEIDPDPESKPARPDPIDMDEDEKEMLSEARARLANTQGKKAKRKERERALEEARRLATLQKKRELKAAGIVMRGPKPKKGQVDYNADIPFEKQPARGFYDTSEESSKAYQAPIGKTLAEADRKRKARIQEEQQEEAKKRSRDETRKDKQTQGQPFSSEKQEQLRKLKEADQISKRRKLDLPAAQVSESELEDIVKLGQASESARRLVTSEDSQEATDGLLGTYDALSKAKTARTPQVATEDDVVMREARNLRNMTEAQTPLLGDDNAPMEEQRDPRDSRSSSVAQTPNPLLDLTPRRRDLEETPRDLRRGRGPAPSATPMRTPYRDHIGLNDDSSSMAGDSVAGTPFDDRRARLLARENLTSSLRSLPQPKNDFELVLDDDDEEEQEGDDNAEGRDSGGDSESDGEEYITISEDAADRDARMTAERAEAKAKELARRSRVVRMDLPRPAYVPSRDELLSKLGSSGKSSPAQDLIRAEMATLMHHDSVTHPIAGSRLGGKSALQVYPDEMLASAREEIRSELAQSFGFPGATDEILSRLSASKLVDEEEEKPSEEGLALESYLQTKSHDQAWCTTTQSFLPRSKLNEQEYKSGQSDLLSQAKTLMQTLSRTNSKEESKLQKILGGYISRSSTLSSQIKSAFESYHESDISLHAFTRLAGGEEVSMIERMEKIREEVGRLERVEVLQQGRYKDLDDTRRALSEKVEKLREERDYRLAEKINQQALDQMLEEE
ncbi:unnamed protein product [Sympodiomycopsis kandeliae]